MDDDEVRALPDEEGQDEAKRTFGQRFWDAFMSSTILQGILSVMVVGTWCYLVIVGKDVASEVYTIIGLVIGFFFGGKMGVAQGREAAKMETK